MPTFATRPTRTAPGRANRVPRVELFDLAVARADSYATRLSLPRHDADALRLGLELWYLRTRFAYRIPLEEVVAALQLHPGASGAVWRGGPGGGWRA